MDPILTYKDSLPFKFKRTMRLYDDYVEGVTIKQNGTESTWKIGLKQPTNQPCMITCPNKMFGTGRFLLALGVAVLIFSLTGNSSSGAILLAIILCLSGSTLLYLGRKRIRIAAFVDESGRTIFDVVNNGPDASRFDEFVEKVKLQIDRCKKN